jgi:hypothetical protein
VTTGSIVLSCLTVYKTQDQIEEWETKNEQKSFNFAVMASLNGFLIVLGFFYWMRMFSGVSMYFRIILDSLYASKYFMIMVGTLLCAFACAIYILDQIQQQYFKLDIPGFLEEPNEYPEITSNKFTNEVIDSIFT